MRISNCPICNSVMTPLRLDPESGRQYPMFELIHPNNPKCPFDCEVIEMKEEDVEKKWNVRYNPAVNYPTHKGWGFSREPRLE